MQSDPPALPETDYAADDSEECRAKALCNQMIQGNPMVIISRSLPRELPDGANAHFALLPPEFAAIVENHPSFPSVAGFNDRVAGVGTVQYAQDAIAAADIGFGRCIGGEARYVDGAAEGRRAVLICVLPVFSSYRVLCGLAFPMAPQSMAPGSALTEPPAPVETRVGVALTATAVELTPVFVTPAFLFFFLGQDC
jgi:hypothetical protein